MLLAVVLDLKRRREEVRDEAFKLNLLGAETVVTLEKVPLVVLGGVDMARARVRQQTHQQIIV